MTKKRGLPFMGHPLQYTTFKVVELTNNFKSNKAYWVQEARGSSDFQTRYGESLLRVLKVWHELNERKSQVVSWQGN